MAKVPDCGRQNEEEQDRPGPVIHGASPRPAGGPAVSFSARLPGVAASGGWEFDPGVENRASPPSGGVSADGWAPILRLAGPEPARAAGAVPEGLLDGLHQAIGPERLVEHGLKPFLPRLHDGMGRVPAEAGHEDDGHVGLDFTQPFERLVAVEIRQGGYRPGRPNRQSGA